ncbi:hypothetical protein [Lactococcus garvieae]|uniref:hypothetical protein n=1 Tax=Lactococcus garvieae TaxID=1363 RepID=UPI002550F29A|nr:hypothetical protein [Lactococcus garvieae]
MNKNKEKIILPIVSIVIAIASVIFILFSETLMFVPVASIIAISLSYIALFINRKNKKLLTYISSGISVFIICVILVIGTIAFSTFKSSMDSINDMNESMSQSKNDFKWTKKEYDAIKLGEEIDLEELITKFGEPTDIHDSEYSTLKTKTVEWNVTVMPFTSVSLSLEKEDNENWIVERKSQTGLKENLSDNIETSGRGV